MAATRSLLRKGSAVILPHGEVDGGERTKMARRITERASASAARRSDLAGELKLAMSQYDPILVIGEIARDVHSAHPDEPDRATTIFSWDAKLEHLLGLALGLDPVPTEVPPREAPAQIARLVDSLFEAEANRIFLEMLASAPGKSRGLETIRLMLRFEHLMDRMEGYTPHLEAIQRKVFEPLHDQLIEALGFCPADIVTVVSAYTARLNEEHAAVGEFVVDGWVDVSLSNRGKRNSYRGGEGSSFRKPRPRLFSVADALPLENRHRRSSLRASRRASGVHAGAAVRYLGMSA